MFQDSLTVSHRPGTPQRRVSVGVQQRQMPPITNYPCLKENCLKFAALQISLVGLLVKGSTYA